MQICTPVCWKAGATEISTIGYCLTNYRIAWDWLHRGLKCILNSFSKMILKESVFEYKTQLKCYAWMNTSGSKSVENGQKKLKKDTIRSYTWIFWKNFALANLIYVIYEKKVLELFFYTWDHPFKTSAKFYNFWPIPPYRDPRRDVCIQFFIKRKPRFGPGWSLGST